MEVVVVFNNSTDDIGNFDNSNAFIYGPPVPTIPATAGLYPNPVVPPPYNIDIGGIAAAPAVNMVAPFFDSVLDGNNHPPPPATAFAVESQPPSVPVGVVYLREPKIILAPNIDATTVAATDSSTRISSVSELSSLLRPPPHISQETLSIILICAGIAAGILFICLLLLCRACAKRRELARVRKQLRLEGFLPPKSSLVPAPFPGTILAPIMYGDDGNEKPMRSYQMPGNGRQNNATSVTTDDETAASPLPMRFPQGALTVPAVSVAPPSTRDEDTSSHTSILPQETRPPSNMLLYAPVATVQVPPSLQRSPTTERHVVFSASQNSEQQVASTRLYQHPTEGISYIQSPMPTAKVTFSDGENHDVESVRTTTIQIHQNGPFQWQAVETPVLSSSPAGVAGGGEPLDAGNLLRIALYSVIQGRRTHRHHHHRRSGSRNRSKSRSRSRERRNRSGSADEGGFVDTGYHNKSHGGVTLVQSRTHPEFLFQATNNSSAGSFQAKNDASSRGSRSKVAQPHYSNSYGNSINFGVGNTSGEVKLARRMLRQASTEPASNLPYSNFRLSRHTAV